MALRLTRIIADAGVFFDGVGIIQEYDPNTFYAYEIASADSNEEILSAIKQFQIFIKTTPQSAFDDTFVTLLFCTYPSLPDSDSDSDSDGCWCAQKAKRLIKWYSNENYRLLTVYESLDMICIAIRAYRWHIHKKTRKIYTHLLRVRTNNEYRKIIGIGNNVNNNARGAFADLPPQ